MTGGMGWIKKDGVDSNGDCWPIQAAIARALKGTLHRYDTYQGPYISDMELGITGLTLWVVNDERCGYKCRIRGQCYLKGYGDFLSEPFEYDSTRQACHRARKVVQEFRNRKLAKQIEREAAQ